MEESLPIIQPTAVPVVLPAENQNIPKTNGVKNIISGKKIKLIVLVVFVLTVFGIMTFVVWKNYIEKDDNSVTEAQSTAQVVVKQATEEGKISAGNQVADESIPVNTAISKLLGYKDWEIFIDDQYKFQLQYPKGFVVIRQPVGSSSEAEEVQRIFFGAGEEVKPPLTKNGIGLTVLLFKGQKPFEEIIRLRSEQLKDNSAILSDYEVKNVPPGKQFDYKTPEGQTVMQRYFQSSAQGAYYELTTFVDKDEYLPTAKKMIDTFRIFQ